MALTVEDGTAKTDADSYSETADAQTYYTDMGYTDTPSDATMRRGSRWLDAYFMVRLKGTKATSGQSMQWPRSGVTDEDGNLVSSDSVPAEWVQAAQEMGRKVTTTMTVSEGKSIRRVKAGSVEVEFASAQSERETLDYVSWLVRPFLKASNRVIKGG